jgi:hypothetical protein
MQLDGIRLVVDHPLNALSNGLQKAQSHGNPPRFLESKQQWTNEIGVGSRCGPRRLNQSYEEAPTIPCTFSSMTFRVLLPLHVAEPFLDVFGAHARCTHRSAVGELADYLPQPAVRQSIIIDFNWGDVYREGVAWQLPPCIKVNPL